MDYINNPTERIKALRKKFQDQTGLKAFYYSKEAKGMVLNLDYLLWNEEINSKMMQLTDGGKDGTKTTKSNKG